MLKKRMSWTKTVAVLGLAASLSFQALPARAQWTLEGSIFQNNSYYGGWVNPYNNTMTQMYQSNMNQIYSQAINRSQLFTNSTYTSGILNSGGGHVSRRESARARRLRQISAREKALASRFDKYRGTMFKESGTSIAPAKLAAVFAKNIGGSEQDLKKAFQVLLDVYKQRAKEQGAPPNDMARTLAYSVAANYIYFNGKAGLDEGPIGVLRGKIRVALNEDAKFRALTDRQKQEMSETMVILAHLVAVGVESIAEKAPADKRTDVKAGFRQLAGVNLKGLLGVDPKRVSFDKSGLVIQTA